MLRLVLRESRDPPWKKALSSRCAPHFPPSDDANAGEREEHTPKEIDTDGKPGEIELFLSYNPIIFQRSL